MNIQLPSVVSEVQSQPSSRTRPDRMSSSDIKLAIITDVKSKLDRVNCADSAYFITETCKPLIEKCGGHQVTWSK